MFSHTELRALIVRCFLPFSCALILNAVPTSAVEKADLPDIYFTYQRVLEGHVDAQGGVDYQALAANATARIVIQNALFLRSKKSTSLTIPWCIYTEPEIAHVGQCEKALQEGNVPFDTYMKEYQDVDRAILDGEEAGFVKIYVKKGKDKILGATIVARHAGEMISQITQAMVTGAGLKTLNNVIHPYPTQSDAIRQVAAQFYVKKFSPALKKWLIRWFRWRR